MNMAFVRFGAGFRVTLVMLFLGGLMLVSGFGFVREWSALQPALAVLTSIWIIAGLIATGCSLWLLNRGSDPRFVWLGAAVAMVAGVSLGVGVLMHIVPCPGPTCVRSRLITAAGLIFFGLIAPGVTARRGATSLSITVEK
jgi:hypothetical protein